jgi:hypothetical protein
MFQPCSETDKPLGQSAKNRIRDGILQEFHRYILDFQLTPPTPATSHYIWPAQVIENNHFSFQANRRNHVGAKMMIRIS